MTSLFSQEDKTANFGIVTGAKGRTGTTGPEGPARNVKIVPRSDNRLALAMSCSISALVREKIRAKLVMYDIIHCCEWSLLEGAC